LKNRLKSSAEDYSKMTGPVSLALFVRVTEHLKRSKVVSVVIDKEINAGPLQKQGISDDAYWTYVNNVVLNVLLFATTTSTVMASLTDAVRRGPGSTRFRVEGADLITKNIKRLAFGPATHESWYVPAFEGTNAKIKMPERILTVLNNALTLVQADTHAVRKALHHPKLESMVWAVDEGLSKLLHVPVTVAGRFSAAVVNERLTERVMFDVRLLMEDALQVYVTNAPEVLKTINTGGNALSEFKKYATNSGIAWLRAGHQVRPPTERDYEVSRRQVCPFHQTAYTRDQSRNLLQSLAAMCFSAAMSEESLRYGPNSCLHCIWGDPLRASAHPVIYCGTETSRETYYDLMAGPSHLRPDWDDRIIESFAKLDCFERRQIEHAVYTRKSALVAGSTLNNHLRDVLLNGSVSTGRSIGPWPIREASMASGYSDHYWRDKVSEICLRSQRLGDERSASSWERWTLNGMADSWYGSSLPFGRLTFEEDSPGACVYVKFNDIGRLDSLCSGWALAAAASMPFFQWALRTAEMQCVEFSDGYLNLVCKTEQFKCVATVSGEWVHFSRRGRPEAYLPATWEDIHLKNIGFSSQVSRMN
jgi:hypothetical protein